MGTLQIRRARPTDLEVLIRELGQRRFFTDRIARQSARRGMLLTAWHGARPIGVLYHRGSGTGTKLMHGAERRLRMLGFSEVALAVEVTDSRAAALFTRLGYADWPYSTIRCYGTHRVEICRIMVKPLGQRQVEARLGETK